jgi:hypothetical protein
MTTEDPNLSTPASQEECDLCHRLHDELNSTIRAVHEFIVQYHDQRFTNENYSGDLGHLIQAQLAAHDRLVEHELTHADQQPEDRAA